ncbi:MAG: lasso peptide biosynthesis protein [Bacteroidetes bacterium]|nr:lasso peptide biosynthesis protein [Bacteroidota bacterium]
MEAVSLLFYAKVLLAVFPFRQCIRRLKPANQFPKSTEIKTAVAVRIAISRANKLACWKNRCLVSSFAARLMLERRGIGSVMYFGLLFNAKRKMQAHAWLMVDDVWVTPRGGAKMTNIFQC